MANQNQKEFVDQPCASTSQDIIHQDLSALFKNVDQVLDKELQKALQLQEDLRTKWVKLEENRQKQNEELQAQRAKLDSEREQVNKDKKEYKVGIRALRDKLQTLVAEKLDFETQRQEFVQQKLNLREEECQIKWQQLEDQKMAVKEEMETLEILEAKLQEMDKQNVDKANELSVREKEVVIKEQELFLDKVQCQEMVREIAELERSQTEQVQKLKDKEAELEQRKKKLEKMEGVQSELSQKMERGSWHDIQDFCRVASEVGTPQEQELSVKVDKLATVLTKGDLTKKVVIKFDNALQISLGVQSPSGINSVQSATGQDFRACLKNMCQGMLSLIRGAEKAEEP